MKKKHLTNLKFALLGLETTVARPSSKTYAKLGLDDSWYLGLALSWEIRSKANGLGNIKKKSNFILKLIAFKYCSEENTVGFQLWGANLVLAFIESSQAKNFGCIGLKRKCIVWNTSK